MVNPKLKPKHNSQTWFESGSVQVAAGLGTSFEATLINSVATIKQGNVILRTNNFSLPPGSLSSSTSLSRDALSLLPKSPNVGFAFETTIPPQHSFNSALHQPPATSFHESISNSLNSIPAVNHKQDELLASLFHNMVRKSNPLESDINLPSNVIGNSCVCSNVSPLGKCNLLSTEEGRLPRKQIQTALLSETELSGSASIDSKGFSGTGDGDDWEESRHHQHLLTKNVKPGAFFQVKKRRKYSHESFPEKLYRMLEETSSQGKDDIVSFTQSGLAFDIHLVDEFLHTIIPQFFRHKKISSFRRQLSMYGFRRVKEGPDAGAYYHPLFKREHPELCLQMKRVTDLNLVLPEEVSSIHN